MLRKFPRVKAADRLPTVEAGLPALFVGLFRRDFARLTLRTVEKANDGAAMWHKTHPKVIHQLHREALL